MRATLLSVDLSFASPHFGRPYGHPLDEFDSEVCATIELRCSLAEWEAFQRQYMAEETPNDRQLGEGILEGELEDG